MKPFTPPSKNVPVLVPEFDLQPFEDAHAEIMDFCRSIFLRRMDRIGQDIE